MNSRQKSVIIGAMLGGALGALGGYLFTRGLDPSDEQTQSRALTLRAMPAGEVVRLLISIMGVLRGIAELGERL